MPKERGERYALLLAQEKLIIAITESICEFLEDNNISRTDLANRMGVTRGYISQILGGRNLSINTLAKVAYALGAYFYPKMVKYSEIGDLVKEELGKKLDLGENDRPDDYIADVIPIKRELAKHKSVSAGGRSYTDEDGDGYVYARACRG